MAVKTVPEGFNTVSPHLVIKGASEAIEFYRKAFGAEEICRMPGPDGQSVMYAELKIGNSRVMLAEEFPGPETGCKSPASLGGTAVTIHLYVEDCDALWKQATNAGAKEICPLMDAFWGDRYGQVKDPFGHNWAIATHKEDLTPEEIGKRAEEWFKNMGEHCKQSAAGS